MKNYKLFSLENNPKIIGVQNGIYQCEILPKKFDNPKKYEQLEKISDKYYYKSEKQRKVGKTAIIEYCELLGRAKITDFISFSPYLAPCQFIVSEKLFNILKNYNLGNYTSFFTVKMFKPKGVRLNENFYMFFQDMLPFSHIDYSKSSIYYGYEALNNKTYVECKDFNDFHKSNERLNFEKLILNSNFNNSLDFFSIRGISDFCISEELLSDLKDNNITGYYISNKIKIEG